MTKVAYLAVIKEEYQLAAKVYNLTGHAYIAWKKFLVAYHYFNKLRNVSRMGHDLETTMYAFK